MKKKDKHFATRCIHAGQSPDPTTGAVSMPLYANSTFAQEAPGEYRSAGSYGRGHNPTRHAFERCLADLENGTHSFAFSSGMAAINAVLDLIPAGAHIIACDDLYGGTYRLFERIKKDTSKLDVTYIDFNEKNALENALRKNTALIWIESPTNPLMKIIDLKKVAAFAKKNKILCAIDNTFASPAVQRPLDHGFDIVMHSVTKYIGGHSDLIAGALVVNNAALADRLKFIQNSTGGVLGPFESFLALRGLKTLALRMERHNTNALTIAQYLNKHKKVAAVYYPGLPSHPGHALAKKQMQGFGGMLSAVLKTDLKGTKKMLSSCRVFTLAESLGGVESLINHPALMTHASMPKDVREKIGITDSLIRLSVGIEDVNDLIADLEQALGKNMTLNNMIKPIHIIGAGLAGSEAAWQIAQMGVPVVLHEMRPVVKTNAHKTDGCAELGVLKFFRSDDALNNAVGLLHEEMRRCGSLILREGDAAAVPAGGALAVDRDIFSQAVTKALHDHPLITFERGEIPGIPPADWDSVIIATGPLTSPALADGIKNLTGEDALAFFDALAPIVHYDSIDLTKAWLQSRYDKEGPAGTGKDYINCAMNEEQYNGFIAALLSAEYGDFKEWEKNTPYFEACMPIEVMAARGPETLRFGPMKPVGLTNPHTGERPHAVVQLRMENKLGTLYNIVGFQTKIKYGEQTRVFKMIPGLENANFARLGGLHRNTFINSPKLLDESLRLKKETRLRFAGQITGCEGYVESAAVGLMAGRFAAAERLGQPLPFMPATTAFGSLLNHITGGANADTFQPMNINFGLFPPLAEHEQYELTPKGKKRWLKGMEKKQALSKRALRDLDAWIVSEKKAA